MSPRERLFALEQFGIKLGLENITRILDALNHPQSSWPSVHVAGTNGKGSVTAMVERGLRAARYRTGRYTSPHLDQIEERIAIDGIPIASADFDEAAHDVLAAIDRLRANGTLEGFPTFFEATTAMAFEIFRRQRVSAAVIEVGLGGRFDATNVIRPAVSVITSIALDHERHLGNTLGDIAFEKAGIIKPGVPVVVATLAAEAAEVVAAQALRVGAPLVPGGRELVEASHLHRGRAMVTLRTPARHYREVPLGLNGAHQIENAALAARTLEIATDHGLPVDVEHVMTALSGVEWPARLEWLEIPSGGHVLIDAAHNPAGAHALADYVDAAGVGPLPLVMGVMKDKDVDAILAAVAPVTSMLVATEVSSPRAMSARELAEHASRVMPEGRVLVSPDPDQAVTTMLAQHRQVCVAGSIFLAGPLRARLMARGASPTVYPS